MDMKQMRVKVPTMLNIRVAPQLDSKVVGFLDDKTVVEVGEKVNTTDGGWYKLEAYYLPQPKNAINTEMVPLEKLRHPMRMERWVCAKYLKRIWCTRKYKTYG